MTQPKRPAAVLAPARAARTIRVLVVDDHMLMRSGLRTVLERAGDIEVVGEAATGEEAIDLVAACRPDVVLMDLSMPGMGGVAATRAITQSEPHPSVLVLTMHAEDEHLTAALRAGASGYLTKALAEEELQAAVRAVADGDVYVRPYVARLLASNLRPVHAPQDGGDADAKFASLSPRERVVLRLVAEGYSGPEIGRSLGIRAKTVDTYRQRIQEKIGLGHRADYIRFALGIGLLTK